jgi:carbon-monoxide dehydrogenase small subunit
MKVTFILNGDVLRAEAEPRQNLVDFLRAMGLTGTRSGCEHGVCGACSGRGDGQVVRGVTKLAAEQKQLFAAIGVPTPKAQEFV